MDLGAQSLAVTRAARVWSVSGAAAKAGALAARLARGQLAACSSEHARPAGGMLERAIGPARGSFARSNTVFVSERAIRGLTAAVARSD
ncbi:MAG: hypothetical protein ACLP8S_12170, partial [Solirubrobacteraceae bacterium]